MNKSGRITAFGLIATIVVLSIGLLAGLTACDTTTHKGNYQPHEHTLSDWQIETPATCTEEGVKFKECTFDGCSYAIFDSIAAIGHRLGEWETETEVTCKTDGTRKKSCENCEYFISETVYATGKHSYNGNGQCEHCSAGLMYRYDEDKDAYFISGFNGNDEITIPASYEGKKVVGIDDNAFEDCYDVTKVIISEGIESIGEYAFINCRELAEITLPDSLTKVGRYSFNNTDWLSSQPDGILYVGKIAYRYMGARSESSFVTIKEGTVAIAPYAFRGQRWIFEIDMPASVTAIGEEAFYNCTNLTYLKLSSGVKSIGKDAFTLCNTLKYVYVYDMLAWCSIEFENADSNPMNLAQKLYLNDGQIWGTVIIPDGAESIPDSTFKNCSDISAVEIPDGVTRIGDRAFEECTKLSDISVPDTLTVIGKDAFMGTAWYSGLENGVVYLGKTLYRYKGIFDAYSDKSVTVKEGTVAICAEAFSSVWNIRSISIPKTVKNIDRAAFAECGYLESIIVDPENPYYSGNGNCIIEKESGTLIRGCNTTVIPQDGSVTKIGAYAFFNCTQITDINIPEGVTEIGEYAFGFTNLISLSLPKSIEFISKNAFMRCKTLADVYFDGTKEQVDKILPYFNSCSNDLVIHCSDGNIDKDGNEL